MFSKKFFTLISLCLTASFYAVAMEKKNEQKAVSTSTAEQVCEVDQASVQSNSQQTRQDGGGLTERMQASYEVTGTTDQNTTGSYKKFRKLFEKNGEVVAVIEVKRVIAAIHLLKKIYGRGEEERTIRFSGEVRVRVPHGTLENFNVHCLDRSLIGKRAFNSWNQLAKELESGKVRLVSRESKHGGKEYCERYCMDDYNSVEPDEARQ